MIKVGALTGVLVALGALGGMGAGGCEARAWPAGMAGITSTGGPPLGLVAMGAGAAFGLSPMLMGEVIRLPELLPWSLRAVSPGVAEGTGAGSGFGLKGLAKG
jgi:hypothetical protein